MSAVTIAADLRGASAPRNERTRLELGGARAGHQVVLVGGEREIAAVLKSHAADHPVHEFDFSLARMKYQTAERFAAVIKGPSGEAAGAVPVLRHDDDILLLNNYIRLPEDAMAAVLAELEDQFHPTNIRTQRNYNDYSIFGRKTEFPDGYLALFDGGVDQYLKSLSKKTRFNLRYYDQRLRSSCGPVETEFVAAGLLSKSLFAEFIEMVGKRYNKSYWTGFLGDAVFAKFRDSVTCTIVRVDGKIAAFNIFYVFGDTLVFTGNTFDEAYSRFSLGFLTTFWSFRHACEYGFAKVILGPGDFGYKSRLSNAIETLYQYSLH